MLDAARSLARMPPRQPVHIIALADRDNFDILRDEAAGTGIDLDLVEIAHPLPLNVVLADGGGETSLIGTPVPAEAGETPALDDVLDRLLKDASLLVVDASGGTALGVVRHCLRRATALGVCALATLAGEPPWPQSSLAAELVAAGAGGVLGVSEAGLAWLSDGRSVRTATMARTPAEVIARIAADVAGLCGVDPLLLPRLAQSAS
jgi:hypothetical protein